LNIFYLKKKPLYSDICHIYFTALKIIGHTLLACLAQNAPFGWGKEAGGWGQRDEVKLPNALKGETSAENGAIISGVHSLAIFSRKRLTVRSSLV
jgi:hypothetical protein